MVVHFVSAFLRNGYEVSVVHGLIPASESSILPELINMGVETVLEPELAFPLRPGLVKKLAETFRSRRPIAIVGVQQRDRAIAMQAANRIGVAGFIALQNSHVFGGRWPINWMKEMYYGWAMRRFPRLVICSSPIVQDEMLKRFRLKESQTVYLPNAIDFRKYVPLSPENREKKRQELGVQPGEYVLVNVGRINKQKGQDILLTSLLEMGVLQRKIKLLLVGGVAPDSQRLQMEKFRDDLQAFVRNNNMENQVVFCGWREDINEVLSAADGYVHSARWEGFPLSVLEAMAAHLPCVWTNCSGRPEGYVDGVHGWLVPKENPTALRVAMESMLELSPDSRRQMGISARRFIEDHFDATIISDRFVKLVETALRPLNS